MATVILVISIVLGLTGGAFMGYSLMWAGKQEMLRTGLLSPLSAPIGALRSHTRSAIIGLSLVLVSLLMLFITNWRIGIIGILSVYPVVAFFDDAWEALFQPQGKIGPFRALMEAAKFAWPLHAATAGALIAVFDGWALRIALPFVYSGLAVLAYYWVAYCNAYRIASSIYAQMDSPPTADRETHQHHEPHPLGVSDPAPKVGFRDILDTTWGQMRGQYRGRLMVVYVASTLFCLTWVIAVSLLLGVA